MTKNFFLCIALLVLVKWKVNSQEISVEQQCLNARSSCTACLQAHPSCSWCSDNITSDSLRCRVASVTAAQCVPSFIDNPLGSVTPTANSEFSMIQASDQVIGNENNVIQLRPQGVNVKLRQGKPEKVNITFRRVLDYPLDLYYVMDLSFSMRDDLATLQRLARNLASSLRNITDNVRFGFGTFVDKVLMPYASTVPELEQNPCLRSQNVSCAPVFGFRHQLPLTEDSESFRRVVSATRISGNIDSPEGGFDALMQIAVCQEQIQWRDGALRVIVFTTDASSHIAMDGKLAAILDINDMKCHLEQIRDSATYEYSESKLQDYPSIGQLKKVFKENKIHSIFAVTEDVLPLYAELKTLLENTFVEALESDSSNVVEIIERAYRSLRSKVQLNPPTVPSNVDLQYRVLCPNTGGMWTQNKLECDTVLLNEEVVFQFEFVARECPPAANQVDIVNITSSSILDRASIHLEYVSCACNCSSQSATNSPYCSGNGTLECGLCNCNPGNSGQRCQCTASSSGRALEASCSRDPFNYRQGDELCSSIGSCECGVCQCDESTFGKLCECSRSGCPNDCGGNEQGTCENCNGNPICKCNADLGYSLNQRTGDCSCNENSCKAPNSTSACNGKGRCDCNRCVCESFLSGKYCDRCEHPQCTGIQDGCAGPELRACAECVYDNDRQDKVVATECREVCTEKNIEYRVVQTLINCDGPETCTNTNTAEECQQCIVLSPDPNIHQPKECLFTHASTGCDLRYKIFWNIEYNRFQVDVRRFNREKDCPGPVDPLLIVLPVIAGIVLIGLIALILWKILQTLRDKREYEQFLEHTSNKQWSAEENPIFANPTNRIENPAFIGN